MFVDCSKEKPLTATRNSFPRVRYRAFARGPTCATRRQRLLRAILIMERISASPSLRLAILLALVCVASPACHKKSAVSKGDLPSADQTRTSLVGPTAGPVQPATVGREEGSLANFIHFPKDSSAVNADSAVQFYCDVSSDGVVETTYAVIGERDEFKKAVQSALDWGRFTPARVDGKPSPVYLGGTVLFMHQDSHPVIVLSLATADRERVGKLDNYIQPQLIGGLRRRLEEAETNASIDLPNEGAAEVLAKINERGDMVSTSVISENPKEIGLGEFLTGAIRNARFTPAYADGKQTPGEINVVANFGEY
jgi:hypothetical protein